MDFPSLCSRFHDYENHYDNHVDDRDGDRDRDGCHSLNDGGHLNRDILADNHLELDSHFDNC